jgi:hypothetical protein
MVNRDKMRRMMLGLLAMMLIASLGLAVMAFAMPATAAAKAPPIQPNLICYGFVCFWWDSCAALDPQAPYYCCDNYCEHPVGGGFCQTGGYCCGQQTCP